MFAAACIVLQNGLEDREHPNGEHAGVHERGRQRGEYAAERLPLPQRLCHESRAKPAQNGLADAHDDEPEWACDPQNICKLIRARDACNQADDPEYRAKTGSCTWAKQNRADDNGNQRQRDRDRPDADTACNGLQDNDQRGQQGQRGQTDDGMRGYCVS